MIKKLYLSVKQNMDQIIFHGIDESISIKTEFELIPKNYVDFFLNHKEHFLFFEQCANGERSKNKLVGFSDRLNR